MKSIFYIVCTVSITLLMVGCQGESEKQTENQEVEMKNLFIGTYTRDEGHVFGKAEGIHLITVDQEGQEQSRVTVAQIINPSFVTLSQDRSYLYAVSETGPNDGEEGSLHAFQIEDARLVKTDSVGSGGFYPCHVTTSAKGDLVIVSNYVGGVVQLYRSSDGKLDFIQRLSVDGSGSHPRQEASHTHMALLSPTEEYLFVADLGANVIWNWRWNADLQQFVSNEQQASLSFPEGAGPRHLAFHPSGDIAAVINELDNSVSLLSFSTEDGTLEILDTQSILAQDSSHVVKTSADIHFHPNGKFLYASNRGENTVTVLAVQDSSTLEVVQQVSTQGEIPRNFAISENGSQLWVANQNSDNLVVFDIDQVTGKLSESHQIKQVMTPVCIAGL